MWSVSGWNWRPKIGLLLWAIPTTTPPPTVATTEKPTATFSLLTESPWVKRTSSFVESPLEEGGGGEGRGRTDTRHVIKKDKATVR